MLIQLLEDAVVRFKSRNSMQEGWDVSWDEAIELIAQVARELSRQRHRDRGQVESHGRGDRSPGDAVAHFREEESCKDGEGISVSTRALLCNQAGEGENSNLTESWLDPLTRGDRANPREMFAGLWLIQDVLQQLTALHALDRDRPADPPQVSGSEGVEEHPPREERQSGSLLREVDDRETEAGVHLALQQMQQHKVENQIAPTIAPWGTLSHRVWQHIPPPPNPRSLSARWGSADVWFPGVQQSESVEMPGLPRLEESGEPGNRARGSWQESEWGDYTLAQHCPVGMFYSDAGGERLLYANPRWCEMTGKQLGEAIGVNWLTCIHPDDRAKASGRWHEAREAEALFHGEYRVQNADGETRWVLAQASPSREGEGRPTGYVGTLTDITYRVRAEEKLRKAAFHDPLTGLPNRTFFKECLSRICERLRRESEEMSAVLFVDLDRFKAINDNLGHEMGDRLLKSISRRLLASVRSVDTVARLSGDEFAILLDEIQDVSDATRVAQRILASFNSPFKLNGHEVLTNASIGIALSRDRASGVVYHSPEDLLRNADTAMYRAKTHGRGCYELFDRTMHERAVALLQLENDLRRALPEAKAETLHLDATEDMEGGENGRQESIGSVLDCYVPSGTRFGEGASEGPLSEFAIYYQPMISLETGRAIGFEALVRWQHPERGLVSPSEFIPVAEDIGKMQQIGRWVLQEACRQFSTWRQLSPHAAHLTLGINLSGKQLAQPGYLDQIDRILAQTGIPPHQLMLEITESVLIQHAEMASQLLEALKRRKVRVCIDDFGTGYSSLSYLHRFPIDTLKIDRSFISRMSADSDTAELVRSIITIAHHLGLEAIAEGVETETQLVQLWTLKCEVGQGYFFSPPLDPTEAEALILSSPQW
ncbi:sensor domain-containing protein [Phormidium sp. CCY1219]|uniref:sensor domain-containing protein n=1 Tax=Phormidium sp. CCY1219 TaxID=2886104 RepID=UPI002D1E8D54|nr:EAL domain-containing protein [Phormidium sp. CCY1219]MEB3828687.1 EAL domain-containing protein [Phormidium sp. CCY1219]